MVPLALKAVKSLSGWSDPAMQQWAASSARATAQILACAETNPATDNVLERLVQSDHSVVRVGDPEKVRHEALLLMVLHGQRASAPSERKK